MQSLLAILTGRTAEPGLDRAALELARIEYPRLDSGPFLAILDSFAGELSSRIGAGVAGTAYIAAANRFLFDELRFRGNSGDYYDPRNSCLNEVLTSRTGIPITLAVVYLEIARRLRQPVHGVGMPGHFIVQYHSPEYSAYIDVFHGGRLLSAEECYLLASETAGLVVERDPRLLSPVSGREILMRMLRNMRGVYVQRQAWNKALRAQDLLLAGDPSAAAEYKQRALLHARQRNFAAARSDFETYLSLHPAAADRPAIERQMQAFRGYQARLN